MSSEIPTTELNRRTVLQAMGATSAAAVATTGSVAGGSAEGEYRLEVLSSKPDQISGGDALIEIVVPEEASIEEVTVYRNDSDVTEGFAEHPERSALTGMVDELEDGENTLTVREDGEVVLEETVTNHPIQGPIFSGEHQQPFACTTEDEYLGIVDPLGQPNVDNDDGIGIPIFAEEDGEKTDEIIGYSRFCHVDTVLEYLYRDTDGAFHELGAEEPVPGDVDTVTVDGEEVDFVVRLEAGTINRWVYTFAVLVDPDERSGELENPDTSVWNGKLFFGFQGGTGIGYTQGSTSEGTLLGEPALERGFAVAYSVGMKTGESYNLQVGGETAVMVKERFVTRFGEPLFSFSQGGSGGGVQGYVYAQNHPDLLDGIIPVVAFPDMVTQTIHVGDCEPLEFYMDMKDYENDKWYDDWDNRRWLLGTNATDEFDHPFEGIIDDINEDLPIEIGTPRERTGVTECARAWRGHAPRVINPHWGAHRVDGKQRFEEWESVFQEVKFTYWDDSRNVYGVTEEGYGRRTWDNVGVQYGLRALRDGNITKAEFLDINIRVGGWKQTDEFTPAGEPFHTEAEDEHPWIEAPVPQGSRDIWGDAPWASDLLGWDEWSAHNHYHSPDEGEDEIETPAQRTSGDLQAVGAAYDSGFVFQGDIDIPVIDWRQYMEPILDQHNSHQSFVARRRIEDATGDADNHVVWFIDNPELDLIEFAIDVMDEWLENIHVEGMDLNAAKPEEAADTCFDEEGELISRGDGVWDGALDDDDRECGECAELMPVYTQARYEAGGPITGDVFKCQLQSVETAIENGVYGDVEWNEEEIARLETIFPYGVCDYDRRDAGYPHPSGLPQGVWDSIAAGDEIITADEFARALFAHGQGRRLRYLERPMTDSERDALVASAEEYRDGPPQIADEFEGPPTDLGMTDGLYRDLTGDGELTIADVQALFDNLGEPEVQDHSAVYNFSRTNPDRVTVFDVQALFTELDQAE